MALFRPFSRGPLAVVDQPRRNGLQVYIGHFIAAHNHGTVLFTKHIHDSLQGRFVFVDIVTVQLNGIFAAIFAVNGNIPASADAQVFAPGDEYFEPGVTGQRFR